MSKMLVYFETSSENLGIVLGKIGDKLAVCENLRIETAPEKKGRGGTRTVTGRVRKAEAVFVEALTQAPGHTLTYDELRKVMTINGFNQSSFSPILSTLCRDGKAARIDGNKAIWLG